MGEESNFIINYVCDCDHTDIMHSEHDGCSLCDCERNREAVIAIGTLTRERNALRRMLTWNVEGLENIYNQLEHYDNKYAQLASRLATEILNKMHKENKKYANILGFAYHRA